MPVTCICNICKKEEDVKISISANRPEIPGGWIEIIASDLVRYHLCSKKCISLFMINHDDFMPEVKDIKQILVAATVGILDLSMKEIKSRLDLI